MAGINVKHQVIQEFSDSYGNEIHEGDLLLLCIKKAEKTERPSVLAKLNQFKELVKNAVVDRTKRKELER